MIRQLTINNIAVIDAADIEFDKGFNLLTGETGAGKSIVIDSLNMLKGERTSKDIIRNGERKASVCAVLDVNDEACGEICAQTGIEVEDNELMISREINLDGKNNIRINGMPATLAMLKAVGDILINIHGQHDNTSLLSKKTHISFLDRFAADSIQQVKEQYVQLNSRCRQLEDELEQMMGDDAQKAQRLDLLTFQIQEIESASLIPGEEEELEERRNILANMQSIAESVNGAYSALYDSDDDYGATAYDLLWQGANLLENSASIDSSLSEIHRSLCDAAYAVEDSIHQLKRYIDNISYDRGELEEIEQRLDLLYNLKRKYGSTVEAVIEYYNQICVEAENIHNSDEIIQKLQTELDAVHTQRSEAAAKLTAARRAAGDRMSGQIMEELSQLDMAKVKFAVKIDPVDFRSDGADDVEFLICTNVGDDFKPLTKIASGGELSRVMLAIKSVLSNLGTADTLIFDEIDTGVSGRAAQSLGTKLWDMSRKAQVICITHLPQIAAMADAHFLIQKHSDNDTTKTTVTPLDEEQRIDEIARTLGGAHITDITRQNAGELLALAKEYKCGKD
ncbi:MAG: DNA repair protein RecN [Clostridia bacterium]|nr:DNA repair protein RecN [Clostridia bacterium]